MEQQENPPPLPAAPAPATNLRPATREEIEQTLSYGLRFNERGKSHRNASDFMAGIAASILAKQLEMSGFVLFKKPPTPPHSAGHYGSSNREEP